MQYWQNRDLSMTNDIALPKGRTIIESTEKSDGITI